MGLGDEVWRGRFPDLYAEAYIDYARCRVQYTVDRVPDELVSRLHLVAVTPDGEVVVCGSEEGWRFLPGGTREPGESLQELARRELMEEAGAALRGDVYCFSAQIADSENDQPYRPHLPHPRACWAYGCCRVDVVGPPTNPDDGETIVEVRSLPVHEAVEYLRAHDVIHAEVLQHADAMGLIQPAGTP